MPESGSGQPCMFVDDIFNCACVTFVKIQRSLPRYFRLIAEKLPFLFLASPRPVFRSLTKSFFLFVIPYVCVCVYVVMVSHRVYQTFRHRPMPNEYNLARLLIQTDFTHSAHPFSIRLVHQHLRIRTSCRGPMI